MESRPHEYEVLGIHLYYLYKNGLRKEDEGENLEEKD
jgi:hypothetical protein